MATLTVSKIITNFETPPVDLTLRANSLTESPDALPLNPNINCDAVSINSVATRNEPTRIHNAREAADSIAIGCGGLGRKQGYPKQPHCSRHSQATPNLSSSLGRGVGRWISETGIVMDKVTEVIKMTDKSFTMAMKSRANPAGSIRKKAKKLLGLKRLWGPAGSEFPARCNAEKEDIGVRVETLGGRKWTEKMEGVEAADVTDVGAWVPTGNGSGNRSVDRGKTTIDEDDDETKGTYDGTLSLRATLSEVWPMMAEGGLERMSSKQHRHRFGFIKRSVKENMTDQLAGVHGSLQKRGPSIILPSRLRKRLMSSGKLRGGFGHMSPPITELPGGQTVDSVPRPGL